MRAVHLSHGGRVLAHDLRRGHDRSGLRDGPSHETGAWYIFRWPEVAHFQMAIDTRRLSRTRMCPIPGWQRELSMAITCTSSDGHRHVCSRVAEKHHFRKLVQLGGSHHAPLRSTPASPRVGWRRV